MIENVWVGCPTGRLGMRKLEDPDSSFSTPLNRSEVAHGLIGGGVKVTRRSRVKRQWGFQWDYLTEDQAESILALYLGADGSGQLVLVPPGQRNFAPQATGSMGAHGGAAGWKASAGTFTANTTGVDLPTGCALSGLGKWSGAGSGDVLSGSTTSESIDTDVASILLPSVDCTVSLYARTASGTASATLAAYGGSSGAGTSQATSGAKTLTTTWQRLTATIDGASSPAAFIYPRLTLATDSAPDIYLAGYQCEYASTAGNWVQPLGTPRVVVAQGLGADFDVLPYRAHTLTLAES